MKEGDPNRKGKKVPACQRREGKGKGEIERVTLKTVSQQGKKHKLWRRSNEKTEIKKGESFGLKGVVYLLETKRKGK